MKKIVLLLAVILFSCKQKQEESISNINVNYVSTSKRYGQLCKPPFYIIEKTFKNNELTMMVYKDTVSYKRVDTLKIYKNGKIIFNNLEVEKVDTKKVENKNKVISVQKIYIPHKDEISVDDFSGEIIYLTNDGILARYGVASNYISLYKPNLYADLHNKILYRKIDFKRHHEELEGKP